MLALSEAYLIETGRELSATVEPRVTGLLVCVCGGCLCPTRRRLSGGPSITKPPGPDAGAQQTGVRALYFGSWESGIHGKRSRFFVVKDTIGSLVWPRRRRGRPDHFSSGRNA